jgi:cell division protein FtsA
VAAAAKEIAKRRIERRNEDEGDVLVLREPAPLTAVLDVGVSKTVCLAARRDPVLEMHPERPLRVLGVGHQTAPAIASGKPADFDACARAIHVAIEEAASMAGSPIKRVVASYAGPGVTSQIVRGAVRVKGSGITQRDIDLVVSAAMAAAPTPKLSFLHVEPLRYFIDDGEAIADPVGHSGKMLALEACIVTAPTEALNALKSCVRQAGAEVEEVIAAPRASAVAALTPEERKQGALLIDLGAGAMGLAAFAAEALTLCETLPMGGVRLTRDLANKLHTTFAAAERVKLHYGVVGAVGDMSEAISAPRLGPDGRLEAATTLRGVISETLTPRLYEMLLTARERIVRAQREGPDAPRRAVLVGGGAQIPGARELAIEALGMPVRIGRPFELCGFDHSEAGPSYATSAGLLRHRLDIPQIEAFDESPTFAHLASTTRNAVHATWNWLRDNF